MDVNCKEGRVLFPEKRSMHRVDTVLKIPSSLVEGIWIHEGITQSVGSVLAKIFDNLINEY